MNNEYLKIINEVRHTLTPYDKFHDILNRYPEIKVVMKQSQMLHMIDRTSFKSLKILEALKSLGLVEYEPKNKFYLRAYLTDTGERFMMGYEETI